jgi:septal ring factor EnvC (AmiA/AmiB activator)
MTENGEQSFDPADMFTRMWTDFASKMAEAGASFDPEKPPPDAARSMRNATLGAMNQHAQEFLRSPEYLAMLKQSFDASIAARKQLNEFLSQAQHEFQSASRQDADEVMSAIQSLESRITSGMDRLGQHVDRLNARLDKLEAEAAAKPAKAKKKAAKRARTAKSTPRSSKKKRKATR